MVAKIFRLLAFFTAGTGLWAGTFTFEVKTDRPALDYKTGEPITFTVRLLDDGQPATGNRIAWVREGDDRKTEQGEAASDGPVAVTTTSDKPGFVRLTLKAADAAGAALKNGNKPVSYTAGAAADPGRFEIAPEPADFDAFWTRQKNRSGAVPLRELERVPVDSGTPGVLAYDVKVASAGPKPLSGYLCLPEGAAPGSLPARIVYFGYGVYPIALNAGRGKDGIVLSVNAHGFLNGQPKDYYAGLAQGELKNYAFNEAENQDPETTYFNGMMLRLLRSLDYVKSLPEWNGRDLIVEGHSQGGMQAAIAAGLDPQVTRCVSNQPWMCDVGGAALGHLRGNWHIKPTPALLYYDPVYHIARYTGELRVLAGLGDYVCPPSGMAAVFNAAKGPRKVIYTQGAGHTGSARGEEFSYTAP
jgi:cephalosporin-C deacetylase